MKKWIVRFLLLYILVCVIVLMDCYAQGGITLRNFVQRGGLVGIGGLFVYLFSTRFGGGHLDDALPIDEESELRRLNRRGWMMSALLVSFVLLITAAIYTYSSY